MESWDATDPYEILQLSPRADRETIHRVYRHLAKRFHPDNPESGDPERFKEITEAFQVLSDPARRAEFDVRYEQRRAERWRIFDQETSVSAVASDRRIRLALLSILYTARRNDADRPGIGMLDLERLLGCPEEHLKFHVWYLKENGLVERTESGTLAITASGVDRILDAGGPVRPGDHLLTPGDDDGSPASGNGAG